MEIGQVSSPPPNWLAELSAYCSSDFAAGIHVTVPSVVASRSLRDIEFVSDVLVMNAILVDVAPVMHRVVCTVPASRVLDTPMFLTAAETQARYRLWHNGTLSYVRDAISRYLRMTVGVAGSPGERFAVRNSQQDTDIEYAILTMRAANGVLTRKIEALRAAIARKNQRRVYTRGR